MRQFNESDVVDEEGRIIISPGLKVRHKKSQFEYTVDGVVQDGEEISVVLNLPEEPRVEPPTADPEVLDSYSLDSGKAMYEIGEEGLYLEPEEEDESDLLVVPQKEFESEYEVK